jgi:signal peptidase I
MQFIVAIVLAVLVARALLLMGLLVPVEVHGSSMAPALRGRHIDATCPRCSAISHIGADELSADGWAACANCGALLRTGGLPVVAGDRIWIDRTAFALRGPQRWELIVFQCPNDAARLCVKRVVGLPGEQVGFRDGRVLINGRPVPRPVGIECHIRPGDGLGQPQFDPSQRCWQLQDGYFVVGDNQAISLDSRNWATGPDLPAKLLVGRPIGGWRLGAEPTTRPLP